MSRRDARSLWLVQNLFDDLQFSDHLLTGSSSPSGAEAYRVATARRSAIDTWAPVSENSTHWVQVDCVIPRPASLLVIDRGSNLGTSAAGFYLEGRYSTGSSWVTVWGSTEANGMYGPGASTSPYGVQTYEGAIVKEFAPQVFRFWRFRIPPSTGYAPRVRNLALGLPFEASEPSVSNDWDGTQVNYDSAASPSNWRGTGRVSNTREGAMMYRFTSYGEYLTAKRHLSEYETGVASWFVPRRGRAEESMCVQIPPVRFPKPVEPGNLFRSVNLPYREHEPLAL